MRNKPGSSGELPQSEQRQRGHRPIGQSLVELALILPVLLIMVLGLVELAFFIDTYLDGLDLVREAARFASLRDPFYAGPADNHCSTEAFNFFFDTACIFSPPAGSPTCSGPGDPFCNGLNSAIDLDMTVDDVVISAFTVVDNQVSAAYPSPAGYYAYSNNDTNLAFSNNWQKDCEGNVVRLAPMFNTTYMNNYLSTVAPPKRGFVAIEFFTCYHQVLNAPIIAQFIPNPVRIHVYTLMPLPAAIPTSTPFRTTVP